MQFSEGQHKLLLHLNSKSLPVQLPISNVRGETWSLEAVPDPDNPERKNMFIFQNIIPYSKEYTLNSHKNCFSDNVGLFKFLNVFSVS